MSQPPQPVAANLGEALARVVWDSIWQELRRGAAVEQTSVISGVDLARGSRVSASSTKSEEKAAGHVVDGSPSTRWTSAYRDDQWLSVDLGEEQSVGHVAIRWEAAFAATYALQGRCLDGTVWTDLAAEEGREGWVLTPLPAGTRLRWLRVRCIRRATQYGFSIWELRIFPSEAPAAREARLGSDLAAVQQALSLPQGFARKVQEQASLSGAAAVRAAEQGQSLRAAGAVASIEAPSGVPERLWKEVLNAINTAATTASEMVQDTVDVETGPECLDEVFLGPSAALRVNLGLLAQNRLAEVWKQLCRELAELPTAHPAPGARHPQRGGVAAGPARPLLSGGAELEKQRIAIVAIGSRGDFQPFLALALGLKARHPRLTFQVFTSEDHCRDGARLGIPCVAIERSCRDVLSCQVGVKAMTRGDLQSMFHASELDWADRGVDFVDWDRVGWQRLTAFAATLVLYNPSGMEIRLKDLSMTKQIPLIKIALAPQTMLPSNETAPVRLAGIPVLDPDVPNIRHWLTCCQYDALDCMHEDDAAKRTPESIFDDMFCPEKAAAPVVGAFSPSLWPLAEDLSRANAEVVGCLRIKHEEQRSKARDPFFGGGLDEVQRFLDSGPPPVYIGWGSMTVRSHAHMTKLAVEALQLTGRRGVLLGGWANLSAECLSGSGPHNDKLLAFSRKSVLFVQSAPHEWLFRRCACAVHHGGVGTTQASLGAGLPTVITPVWCDQFEIASLLTSKMLGVHTRHLADVTPGELADAITRCCSEPIFRSTASKVAAQMEREDGVARLCGLLEGFAARELATGRWAARHEAALEELRARRLANRHLSPGDLLCTLEKSCDLRSKHPALRQYWESLPHLWHELTRLQKAGKLWYVKTETVSASAAAASSSAAGSYFLQYTLLEEVSRAAGRVRLKRRRGVGPSTGWVKEGDLRVHLGPVDSAARLVEVMSLRSNMLRECITRGRRPPQRA